MSLDFLGRESCLGSFSEGSSKHLSRSLCLQISIPLCFSRIAASSLVSFSVCAVAVSIMSCAALMPALSFLFIESLSFTFPSLRSCPTLESSFLMLLSWSLKEVSFARRVFFLLSLPPFPAFFWQLQLSPPLLVSSLSFFFFFTLKFSSW